MCKKMTYKMFLDDLRDPPDDGFVVCRSSRQAISHIKDHGLPNYISFDHDLGGDDTSMPVARYIIEMDLDYPGYIPSGWKYSVHSANPVGRDNLYGLIGGYLYMRDNPPKGREWQK